MLFPAPDVPGDKTKNFSNKPCFTSIDCNSFDFIRVYQYDSRAIWNFCTKTCIKFEITFMLIYKGNILLCFL